MKTIKYILMLVIGLAMATVVNAQKSLPMLQSQSDLREYAFGIVVRGYRDVSAQSLVRVGDEPTWVEVKGTGAEDVLNKLFSKTIKYGLANPTDVIEGRVWLYDEDNHLIFYGGANYLATDIGSKTPPTYSIWLQSVPLPLKDVVGAEVLVVGEDGRTVDSIPLMRNEKGGGENIAFFDSYLAGAQNGILSVRFSDGSVATWNLSSPNNGVAPLGVSDQLKWKIEGHTEITLGSTPETRIVKVMEIYELPTLLIHDAFGGPFTLDVSGLVQDGNQRFLDYPDSFVVRKGTDIVSSGMFSKSGPQLFQNKTTGDFRMKFTFPTFQKPGKLYTGPRDGGKG